MWPLFGQSRIIACDETLTLLRPQNALGAGVEVVGGVRQKTLPPIQFTIKGNVQPVTGDDLLLVPEGDRFNEQLYLWVQQPDEKPQPNDIVVRDANYLVMASEDWGSYTKCRIQRIDVGPDRYVGQQ